MGAVIDGQLADSNKYKIKIEYEGYIDGLFIKFRQK